MRLDSEGRSLTIRNCVMAVVVYAGVVFAISVVWNMVLDDMDFGGAASEAVGITVGTSIAWGLVLAITYRQRRHTS